MKFSEMPYSRIDISSFTAEAEKLCGDFSAGTDTSARLNTARRFFTLWQHYRTMHNLAYFRHTGDTADKYYSGENDYYNAEAPKFEALNQRFSKLLASCPDRPALEKALGTLLFKNIDIALRSFDEKIMDDMAEENALCSRYERLIASAEIDFDGEKLNISQLGKYMASGDRSMRMHAHAARSGFFEQNADELDEIYDKLVKCRDRQARKLGYKNFVALGYLRMRRNCYDSADVSSFRQEVCRKLVPICTDIAEKQRQRLGVDKLMFYDEGAFYPTGDPCPHGTPEEIFANGRRMYRELSPVTGEFFDFMLENGLFDVLGRAGKAPGGYSDDLADFRSPFIFANFNGTSDDINVLTHESGHALEYYLARDVYPPDYAFPTAEACEIHSMSMEFLTWPYMELFFGGDAGKYRYQHLSHALTFIPYGCTVDEFQQIVYENPSLTPAERKKAWRELEKKYTPWIDYGDDRFFGTGGRWQRQLHIYMFPFYYIDYCLAETCALQFWAMAQKDRVDALDRYLALCRLGGTDVFTALINKVGLRSPFEKGCLDGAAAQAVSWLDDPANAKF